MKAAKLKYVSDNRHVNWALKTNGLFKKSH